MFPVGTTDEPTRFRAPPRHNRHTSWMACPGRPRSGLPGRKPYRPDCGNPTKVVKKLPVSIGHFMPGVAGGGQSRRSASAPGSPTARFSGCLRSWEWVGGKALYLAVVDRIPNFKMSVQHVVAKPPDWMERYQRSSLICRRRRRPRRRVSTASRSKKRGCSWESSGTYDKQTLVAATESQPNLGLTRLTLLSYTPCV
jgi:hypothetical protein